ncbi:7864_t:CDS:2 [Funneliformis geosporum]|nr:7864_t:CDS:2 [Funneliformis geosporum]
MTNKKVGVRQHMSYSFEEKLTVVKTSERKAFYPEAENLYIVG